MITSISARSSGHHARVVSVATALAVIALILLAGNVAISSAYEGVFCHQVKLAGNGGYCQSNEETRRGALLVGPKEATPVSTYMLRPGRKS